MIEHPLYDTIVIGGGLAGLALAIQLAQQGHRVALFEKEIYPFHKVCGEYLSLESWDFIEGLGLPLHSLNLPIIKKLLVSSPNGNTLEQDLPLGGFGISRYRLDNALKNIAVALGVSVFENCKVQDVIFKSEQFDVHTAHGVFTSKTCAGSFGKLSNLDVKWNRSFLHKKNKKLTNYIGVKYHIKIAGQADTIALHNFKNGYCGISKIDNDTFCLCYLTNAANLNLHHNSIGEMEKNILYQNPFLKQIFETGTMLFKKPVIISQVSFAKKVQVQNHILLCGDAAGMITPLCGNGMSMALHSSKIAASAINDFLHKKITRQQLENNYVSKWQQTFGKRLIVGRVIQQLFGKNWATNCFIRCMNMLPYLTKQLIKQTHGKPF